MRRFVFLLSAIVSFHTLAQFTDDFSDGDFTSDPVWAGDDSEFIIIDNKLRSNGPAESAVLYLSTPNVEIENAEWQFLIELGFAPSASNQVKIYLVSDSENLESDLNGYFLEIGQSGDDRIKFYRQDGASDELLFTGSTLLSGNVTVRINVTRGATGQWEISSDPTGGNSLSSEGSPFIDDTYASSYFFGVVCAHTSTRRDLFFFDDFSVLVTAASDNTPPTIESVSVISDSELEIIFSEDLDQTSAETTANYSIDQGISVANSEMTSPNIVTLTTSVFSNGQDYELTVDNVEDLNGNAIVPNSTDNFSYLVTSNPQFREVVVNELFSDQGGDNPLSNDFIELFNATEDKFFDLENWSLEDNNASPVALESFILRPQQYLIVSSDTSEFDEELNRMEVSLPNYNNDDDYAVLRFSDGSVIDSVGYGNTEDGISIEQINPAIPFFLESNYGNSTDENGSTPGLENSIFDDTPDTSPPEILSISMISSTELAISFSEMVEETSSENAGNYSIDGGISVEEAVRDSEDFSLVHLQVGTLISGETRTITISGVEDLFGNAISNASVEFRYIETEDATEFDVVINEFLADPTPSIGLPDAEFVELYNRSDKFFNLENWMLDGFVLPDFILEPDQYVIVVEDNDAEDFMGYENVLTVSTLTLNNSGSDTIQLVDNNSVTIHSISFDGSEGGISAELINPNGPDYSSLNYGLSADSEGGTPGEQNSIFDDTPDTTPPAILEVKIISATELVVLFNEPLERSSAESVMNYSIDGNISIAGASLELLRTMVSLSVSALTSAEIRTLSINNVADLSGNTVDNQTTQFEYIETQSADSGDIVINEFLASPTDESGLPNAEFIELLNKSSKYISLKNWTLADRSSTSDDFNDFVLRPDSIVILSADGNQSLFESFGEVLEVANFPSLNNSGDDIILMDSLGQIISSLTFNSSEPGITSELVNPNHPCYSFSGFLFSNDPAGGTPGQVNSVFDDSPDITPPSISSYGFETFLAINFSEVMDAESLNEPSNYSSTELSVNSVDVIGDFPTSVEVFFEEEIILGEVYEVSLNGLTDCSGNQIEATTISFGFGRKPEFNELIITEVLFDESPAIGLPEREYFEVYNASEDVITTAGLSLTDATNTIRLPAANLNSDEYYVFTSTAGASEFGSNAIGVSGFSSLNNSGELLVLSIGDTLVSSFDYDPDWHDEEKSDGGYSLEMVDITNPCLESAANWRSSINPSGGTPGRPNSISEVIPDSFGPEVLKITAIASDTIKIDFDEKIDPYSKESAKVNFQPSLEVNRVIIKLKEPNSLFVILPEELQENAPYSLEISEVFDCSGNEVQSSDLVFALPLKAQENEIKLSEVLFNPRTNGVDFVEVFNDSENYISLKDWKLARLTDGGIDDAKVISSEELVFDPNEYLVLTTDPKALLTNYPKGRISQFIQMGSLPAYSNDTGNVVLLNRMDEVMEHFFYDEAYHYNLLESVDGVSLERISFSSPSNDPNNWRSASSREGFATPGYTNSQSTFIETPSATLEVNPKVFIPGNSGSGRDFTTINYQFSNPGQFANVNIYDQNGRLVKNLVQGELLATSGFLRWDGETNNGSMARLGYYVVLFEVYDASGNTEIIKETVAVGRDF